MNETTRQEPKRRTLIAAAMVCVAISAAIAALVASTGPAAAEPAGSASASASATPPPPPPARGADIPTERSKPPTATEWKEGRAVSAEGAEGCTYKLLREYLRVTCINHVGVGLAAGDPEDVRVWISGRFGSPQQPTALADIPLRRGQGFIVSFNDVAWEYDGGRPGDGGHVIVSWREGEPDPLIVRTPGD